MAETFDSSIPVNNPVPQKQDALRKKYSKPKLESLGDLRSTTLGASTPADFDSGWPSNPGGDYQRLGP